MPHCKRRTSSTHRLRVFLRRQVKWEDADWERQRIPLFVSAREPRPLLALCGRRCRRRRDRSNGRNLGRLSRLR